MLSKLIEESFKYLFEGKIQDFIIKNNNKQELISRRNLIGKDFAKDVSNGVLTGDKFGTNISSPSSRIITKTYTRRPDDNERFGSYVKDFSTDSDKFEKWVKNRYGDDVTQYNAPDHKKIEVAHVLPEYEGRKIAIVRADNNFVPMYQSSGHNGVKNEWFPMAGLMSHNHPFYKQYEQRVQTGRIPYGWITKNSMVINKNGNYMNDLFGNYFDYQNPKYRNIMLGTSAPPVNLNQINQELKNQNITTEKAPDNYYYNNGSFNPNEFNKNLFNFLKNNKNKL